MSHYTTSFSATPFRTTFRAFLFLAVLGALLGAFLTGCDAQAQNAPDEGFVEVNGARIHYQSQGDAGDPAMVLVHGYPLSGDLFREQRDGLSDTYRVVTLDLRGYGDSTAPDSNATVQTYAQDVLDVMTELNVDRAIIGGMSMGGPIVFEMYRRAPARFRGMILIDTTPKPAAPAEAGLWRGVAAQARQQGVPSLVPFLLKDMLTGDTRMNRPQLADFLGGIVEAASLDAAVAGANALASRPDSRPTQSTISVPTLILTGAEDSIYPFETARDMNAAIPNSTLVLPAGAAHAAIIEAGSAANDAIRSWAGGIGG